MRILEPFISSNRIATVIREIESDDFSAIVDIYNHYIRHTIITFEEQEITPTDIADRVIKIRTCGLCWTT